MYGIITRNEAELDWAEFDRTFFEVCDVTGRTTTPVENGINAISCFGDTATAEVAPELVPVDSDGNRATREQPYFDWSYVCPSRQEYREGLLEMIEEAAAKNDDVRLDDVGFPRQGYCHCEVCEERFVRSEYDDWLEWRASVITSFVAEAADRIPGRLFVAVYPDPYPGHLYERAGIDLDALSAHVDEFVIPLYDTIYDTTYWLEVIASGFKGALDVPFGIELYAVDVEIDNLLHATEVARAYAENVYFGYDAGNARAALRRQRAEENEGVSHGG